MKNIVESMGEDFVKEWGKNLWVKTFVKGMGEDFVKEMGKKRMGENICKRHG